MRRWIAYIFIAIFSLQILPVKEIGKVLFKGQILEEEVHNYAQESKDDTCKNQKEGDPVWNGNDLQDRARSASLSHEINTAMHNNANLPDYYVPDIPTPPPNC